jgi:prefoldin alpha subunit
MAERANKENEAREVLIRLKYIEGQMASIQNQLSMFEKGLMEISGTKVSLESLKALSKDSNSLLPLGSGLFAKGLLLKQDKVLVEVGAGAIVEKDLVDAGKILDTREKDIRTNILTFQQALVNLEGEYNSLSDKARSLVG